MMAKTIIIKIEGWDELLELLKKTNETINRLRITAKST